MKIALRLLIAIGLVAVLFGCGRLIPAATSSATDANVTEEASPSETDETTPSETDETTPSETDETTPSETDETTSETDAVQVVAVTISGANSVIQGETITLTAVVAPSNASQEVTWTSTNEAVLTVTAEGVVTGVAPRSDPSLPPAGIRAASVANPMVFTTHTVMVIPALP